MKEPTQEELKKYFLAKILHVLSWPIAQLISYIFLERYSNPIYWLSPISFGTFFYLTSKITCISLIHVTMEVGTLLFFILWSLGSFLQILFDKERYITTTKSVSFDVLKSILLGIMMGCVI